MPPSPEERQRARDRAADGYVTREEVSCAQIWQPQPREIPGKWKTHGTFATYKKGCRCDPCRQSWNGYKRSRHQPRRGAEGHSDR